MVVLVVANLALRFVLELCALAALAYWGATRDQGAPIDTLLAVGVPLVIAVLWGLFVSPKAAERGVPAAVRWPIEVAVFLAAAAGLVAADRPTWAVVLLVAYLVNRLLLLAWRDREPTAFRPS
jgi:hypothetical protein